MPKWTEYTTKYTLADNDEVMLYDATARANKRGLMSKFWDYVVDKMATAVISKLETNNKTIIGAINALNSDSNKRFGTADTTFNTISDIPEKGSCFGVNAKRLDLNETFSIPEYSRCIFINYGSSADGAILAIASNGDLYIAFRNSRKWVNGRKL